MVSFTNQIKDEICRTKPFRKQLLTMQAFGMLLYGKAFSSDKIQLTTENKLVAKHYTAIVSGLVPLQGSMTTYTRQRSNGHSLIATVVDDPCDRSAIVARLQNIKWDWDNTECCRAFVSGAFLSCGSVITPQKSYRLEFVLPRPQLADWLELALKNLDLSPKRLDRRGTLVLYFRESEQIEDIIAHIGAPVSAMALMDVKILKEMRNKVNRVTNCETANIDKTVVAAVEQLHRIRHIQETCGLDCLPQELAELAALRLENPDLSLRELGKLLSAPLSRSGVNHRMGRLMKIADEMDQQR